MFLVAELLLAGHVTDVVAAGFILTSCVFCCCCRSLRIISPLRWFELERLPTFELLLLLSKNKKIWLILKVCYFKTCKIITRCKNFSLICPLPFYSIRVCPSFPTVSYTAYCTPSIAMRSWLLRRWRVSRRMVSRHQWSRCALRWGTSFNRGSKPSRGWMCHIYSHCHGHGLLYSTHSLVQLMTK